MTGNLVVESTRSPHIYRWMLLQSSEVWRDDLTADQYVHRDDVLTPSALYNFQNEDDPRGIYYYILRDMSIKLESGDDPLTYNIVCSCELMVRDSWRFEKKNGLKKVLSGCVGSVYTLPNHRSKGHANYLMKELDRIAVDICGEEGFLSLYSEVDRYYERFQYYSYPVSVTKIAPSSSTEVNGQLKPLKFNEFNKLIDNYREKLAKYIIQKDTGQAVAIVPTCEMIEWHHIRSRYIMQTLYGKLPNNFGFQLDINNFIIFSHDYGDHSITVHMVLADSLVNLKTLLEAAAIEATKLNYKNVHLWDSQLIDYKLEVLTDNDVRAMKAMISDKLNGKMDLKNDSLSALKMLDGSYSSWEANHKWPWF